MQTAQNFQALVVNSRICGGVILEKWSVL